MAKEEKGFAFLAPLVVIIVLAVLGAGAFFVYQKSQEFSGTQNNQNQQTACTQEAKQCPDGSFVSRTGTNCEFAECPSTNADNAKNNEKLCTDSGGKVATVDCYCPGTADFYNNCLVGGCTCTPDPAFKRQIKTCDCGQGNCFDGSKCVKMANN